MATLVPQRSQVQAIVVGSVVGSVVGLQLIHKMNSPMWLVVGRPSEMLDPPLNVSDKTKYVKSK